MGRRRKKVNEEPETFNWPFKICIDLRKTQPKICFMSGCPREYYPEDPGFSKLGITYCLPDPADTAKCNFVPSSNLLQKPISTLGYGIGGLLSSRFAKLSGEDTPGPSAYQPETTERKMILGKKEERTKWKDFVAKYERIVKTQYDKYEAVLIAEEDAQRAQRQMTPQEGKLAKAVLRKSMAVSQGLGQNKSALLTKASKTHMKKAKQPQCASKVAAFGICLKTPRFATPENKLAIGVGTYNVKLPPMQSSFQITNPKGELIPRVRTVCNPVSFDKCMNCSKELIATDYYQTKNKRKVKNYDNEMDSKYKFVNLSLCRECYCEALNFGLEPWPKERIPFAFVKARHCSSVHDHKEGLDGFLTKATCKEILHLSRKELLFSRYFKDTPCQKAI